MLKAKTCEPVNLCASRCRAHSRQLVRRAGGCFPVDVAGIENVSLSRFIDGHNDYSAKMEEVLTAVQLA